MAGNEAQAALLHTLIFLMIMSGQAQIDPNHWPGKHHGHRPSPPPQALPLPVLSVPLNYNYQQQRYMMTIAFGSQQQQASLVLDTGSGSLYTNGFNTSASSATSTNIQPVFGYGSSTIRGSTFYRSAFSITGILPGSSSPASLNVSSFKWIAAQPYVPSYNPTLTAGQGLVGFAPPGGLTGGKALGPNLTDATGALCPAAPGSSSTKPCDNTPTVFGALVDSGALPRKNNMFSLYIARNTADNGTEE